MRTKKPVNESGLILDLLYYGTVTQPKASDEIYFQLCRQLSGNEDKNGLIIGWQLFTLYIHTLTCSRKAAPFIKTFLLSQYETFEEKFEESRNSEDQKIFNIISYCLKSFERVSGRIAESSPSIPSFQMNMDVINYVFQNKDIEVEVALMNGSIFYLTFQFGECMSVFTIIVKLYERMCGLSDEQNSEIITNLGIFSDFELQMINNNSTFETDLTEKNKRRQAEMRALTLFRGFQLYRVEPEHFLEGRKLIKMY